MAHLMVLIDKRSGISSITVSGLSRLVALFSIIPILLAILGLMAWRFLRCRRRRTAENLELSPFRWKPSSLKYSTLIIYLALIFTLIILLEAARLALPERGASEAAARSSAAREVVIVTKTLVVRADSHLVTIIPTQAQALSVFSDEETTFIETAQEPTEGWLTVGEVSPSLTDPTSTEQPTAVGWLSDPTSITEPGEPVSGTGWLPLSEPDPTSTEQPTGAPPGSVGWLPGPTLTTELPPAAPGPGIGWLLNEDAELSPHTMYFIGTFLPVLIASIFAIPWKILDHDVKSLEPFAQLASSSGKTAPHNLLLHYNGVSGFMAVFTAPFTGHSAVALSTFLSYSSALLIPLATGSIGLTLQGECLQNWKKQCSAALEAADPTIRATQGLLAAMACAVIVYMVLLRGRTFGVMSDPRSMLGIASLSLNPYLSAVVRRITLRPDGMFSTARAAAMFEGRTFQFGYISYATGEQEYGIIVANDFIESHDQILGSPPALDVGASKRWIVSGILMRVISFTIFILSVCILILYYSLTYTDSGFERFMSSQKRFGPRFLFALFGVIVGFGWTSIFHELAIVLPAWDMYRRPSKPERTVLMPLNPNPYVGVIAYLARRHKLLAVVAIMTVLSDFLPIMFANVPFSNAITWKTHRICVWMSVGVLTFMLAVLVFIVGILLCKFQRNQLLFIGTDLATLAAVLYLVCRSEDYLAQVKYLSVAREADIIKRIKSLDSRYSIISIIGEDGNPHITIRAG
ncbi:hypothetical protein FVEN_g6638 [Fusarium venenatum]|nr:hypothetical protein FVEN_g6638 [Fusarium venenatum]